LSITLLSFFFIVHSFPFKSESPLHPDEIEGEMDGDPVRIETHESLAMSELPLVIRPDYGLVRAFETIKSFLERKNKRENEVRPRSDYTLVAL
ncbi:hypothetical protein PFISCL1PPCAC_6028, partial [Pristionchus fissidentatus]